MRFFAIATLLTVALALAGCGAGASVNTLLGGASVSGNIGTPPPVPAYAYGR